MDFSKTIDASTHMHKPSNSHMQAWERADQKVKAAFDKSLSSHQCKTPSINEKSKLKKYFVGNKNKTNTVNHKDCKNFVIALFFTSVWE